MRRFVMLAAVGTVAAATVGAASAAPSQNAVTHANNHVCATAPAGVASCTAIRHDTYINGKATAAGTTGPTGYNPSDLQSAYNLPTGNAGAGQTVAIVDAYNLPSAASDIATYRSVENLPSINNCTISSSGAWSQAGPCFAQVGQSGTSSLPATDASWGQEIALDIEMVSATCPNCNILLVEANSASFADLGAAVNTAAALKANAISNSYGGSDSSPQSAYDHTGIAITASTGDNGYGVESPASYASVVAVGGTSLSKSASGWTETAWSGAGSGCSRYNAKPGYQSGVSTQCGTRALADVSAVADPNTGVSVFDSTPYQGASGWMVFGGTSVSSPIIASVFALAGNTAGVSSTAIHQQLYSNINNRSALHDVTSGRNGRCGKTPVLCTAGSGWDGPTGLGTPNGTSAF